MTATAASSGEGNVGTRVDCEAIILVLDNCARDIDVLRVSNIERIGVVPTISITGRVVKVDLVDGQSLTLVDAHQLDWRVLEVESSDGGSDKLVGSEELWLCYTTVASLSVPVFGTISINHITRRTTDVDVGS